MYVYKLILVLKLISFPGSQLSIVKAIRQPTSLSMKTNNGILLGKVKNESFYKKQHMIYNLHFSKILVNWADN